MSATETFAWDVPHATWLYPPKQSVLTTSAPFLVRRYGYYVGGGMGWEYNPLTVLYPAEMSLDASVPKTIALIAAPPKRAGAVPRW